MKAYTLAVIVSPGASADEVVGWHEAGRPGQRALKIRLRAPAQEGKANQALIEFLAGMGKIPKQSITLKTGSTARIKQLCVTGDAYIERIIAALPKAE